MRGSSSGSVLQKLGPGSTNKAAAAVSEPQWGNASLQEVCCSAAECHLGTLFFAEALVLSGLLRRLSAGASAEKVLDLETASPLNLLLSWRRAHLGTVEFRVQASNSVLLDPERTDHLLKDYIQK